MSEKQAVLPPKHRLFDLWWWKSATQMNSVKSAAQEAWDAQDARIAELEVDAESTSKRLGDLQLESIRQANKIAELYREIRGAWKFVKLCFFPLRNRLDIQQRDDWLARNAEKE